MMTDEIKFLRTLSALGGREHYIKMADHQRSLGWDGAKYTKTCRAMLAEDYVETGLYPAVRLTKTGEWWINVNKAGL